MDPVRNILGISRDRRSKNKTQMRAYGITGPRKVTTKQYPGADNLYEVAIGGTVTPAIAVRLGNEVKRIKPSVKLSYRTEGFGGVGSRLLVTDENAARGIAISGTGKYTSQGKRDFYKESKEGGFKVIVG